MLECTHVFCTRSKSCFWGLIEQSGCLVLKEGFQPLRDSLGKQHKIDLKGFLRAEMCKIERKLSKLGGGIKGHLNNVKKLRFLYAMASRIVK